jgi:hypothetical protein
MSDARIRKLAKAMGREMALKGAVKVAGMSTIVGDVISKAMITDQEFEEQIEGEAREMLSRQRNLPPPGTGQYEAAFQQAKRVAAGKRGIKF